MDNLEKPAAKSNPKALIPIIVFLVLYLGNGIFFEYIKPAEGQMGFYVVSVVLAFSIALIVAFLQNRKRTFDEKIRCCAKGIGDDNITIMLFIFLIAGAFSGIASEAGGASSTANLLLSIIPGKFAIPGPGDCKFSGDDAEQKICRTGSTTGFTGDSAESACDQEDK